jgi:hypothetical protein
MIPSRIEWERPPTTPPINAGTIANSPACTSAGTERWKSLPARYNAEPAAAPTINPPISVCASRWNGHSCFRIMKYAVPQSMTT